MTDELTDDFEALIRSGQLPLSETPRAISALLSALDAARARRAESELQAENDAAWECFGHHKDATLAEKIAALQKRRDEEISACTRASREAMVAQAEVLRLRDRLKVEGERAADLLRDAVYRLQGLATVLTTERARYQVESTDWARRG